MTDRRLTPDERRADVMRRNQARRDGWWNMVCWNGLSAEQQDTLITLGTLPIIYLPEGECITPAEVAIETRDDRAPGPRFYCRPCGAKYLS